MIDKRKYLGIPTQEEIIQQFNEITNKTKNIKTFEQIINFRKNNPNVEIEINYKNIDEYNKEIIKCIRYEYKNIMVYSNIENNKIEINPYITLFDDDGIIQFADEKYNNYNREIERVAKMGLLNEI